MHVTDTLREQVKRLLSDYPAARDDDQVLMYFWLAQFSPHDPGQLPVQLFLKLQREGTVPKMQALTRTRRWAQGEHPELRGAEYEARNSHQDTVKAELGYHQQFHPVQDLS